MCRISRWQWLFAMGVVAVLGWALAFPGHPLAAQEAPESGGNEEAVGYILAHGTNLDSLRCYDLMLWSEVTRFHADPPSISRGFRRIIADHDRERFLLLLDGSYQTLVDDPEKRVHRRGTQGFFVDGLAREKWVSSERRKAHRVEVVPTEGWSFTGSALRQTGLSDPRFLGLADYPTSYEPSQSMREVIRANLGHAVDVSTRPGVEGRVLITTEYKDSEVVSSRYTREFDTERLVPVSLAFEFGNRGDFRRTKREAIRWEDQEGHQVPVEVQGEQLRHYPRTGTDMLPENYELTLRWQSINEPEALTALSSETLADPERVEALLREVRQALGGDPESPSPEEATPR